MAEVMNHAFQEVMLNALAAAVPGATLHLMKGNTTIDQEPTPGSFLESDFPGYAPKTLPGTPTALWQPTLGYTQLEWEIQSWMVGSIIGSQFITGYWLADAGGAIIAAERFATAYQLTQPGQVFRLKPHIHMMPIPPSIAGGV